MPDQNGVGMVSNLDDDTVSVTHTMLAHNDEQHVYDLGHFIITECHSAWFLSHHDYE